MEVKDKIIKARVKLQKDNPFFSYLVLNLNMIEEKEVKTIGVDEKGNCYYNLQFIDKLEEEQIKGLLSHEVLHCLTPESKIVTSEGFKDIKDIKIGDLVYSKYSTFTKVKKTSVREYKGKIYKFKTRFGLPTNFTDEHPILSVKSKNFRKGLGFRKTLLRNKIGLRFYKAKDLRKNDGVVITIPPTYKKRTRKMFNTRVSYKRKKVYLDEDVAYFLGFFVGDGSLHKTKKQGIYQVHEGKTERVICLTLSLKDDSDRLLKVISHKFFRKAKVYKIKDKKAVRIIFSAKSLATFLRNNFYDNNGKKKIPKWFIYERKKIIKSFIEGLTNADGHKRNGRITITSVYVGVYSLLPLLLLKLRRIPAFSRSMLKKYKKFVYSIAFNENPKRETGLWYGNKFIMPIESINVENYRGEVYNLETEAHTYCVPFYTTHNCALEHLIRVGDRDKRIFNIAADLVINNMLSQNGFNLVEGGFLPSYNEFDFGNGLIIKDLDKKTAEEVYKEIMLSGKVKQSKTFVLGLSKSGKGKNLDKHLYPSASEGNSKQGKDKEKGEGLSKKQLEQQKGKWRKLLTEASIYAKQQGNLPMGVERVVDLILNDKINWKQLLYKYITRELPYDYTYSRPSKRSVSTGVYMPSILRENIQIVVSVDTSGSIGQEELSEFLGEIINIAKSFNNIEIKLIVCDCEVKDVYRVANGDIARIQDLKIKGGGGTSHIPIYDYIKENLPNTKFIINFTDGYTSFPDDEEVRTIWLITKNGCKNEEIPFGEIIRLD